MNSCILQNLEQTDLVKRFNQGKTIANLSINQEALVYAGAFYADPKKILIIKSDLYSAQLIYQQVVNLVGEDKALLYGAEESLRVEAVASSPELKAQRIDSLISAMKDEARIIVTHVGALIRYLPKVEIFESQSLNLVTGQEYSLNEIKNKLLTMGFSLQSKVELPLVFSFRGSIIDFWPANQDNPIRVEFFDNEIESIRYFSSDDQRTIEVIDSIQITPADDNIITIDDLKIIHQSIEQKNLTNQELIDNINNDLDLIGSFQKENHLYRYRLFLENDSIVDYFKPQLVVVSNYQELHNKYQHIIGEQIQYIQELHQDNKALLLFSLTHQWDKTFHNYPQLDVKDFYNDNSVVNDVVDIAIPINRLEVKIREVITQFEKVVFVINSQKLNELIDVFIKQEIQYTILSDQDQIKDDVNILVSDLFMGFSITSSNTTFISSNELYNQSNRFSRFEKKFIQAQTISNYQELSKYDYVVHFQHGIGQYLGIVNKEVQGIHYDFLQILYRNDAMLYVPLDQFKLVRKFISGEGIRVKLNSLGTGEWAKAKQKIETSVEDIAEKLIDLYVNRQEKIGFAFSKDSELQKNFEDEFDYQLTKDQETAIDEIKEDMESLKPMDRLLCGDVGFGKTEVALRAAFKAVIDKKQVAYLCPTTILSDQHYRTFIKRLENYPVRVAVLNRFVSDRNAKLIIDELRNGTIDILIGTHRILSKDIKYLDLGLLIIDEEQRFGVVHKEKIKELKNSIDVLSLSATPIPRTLQMSLIGIRSLSQLNTPPLNRLNVQTYVIEKNDSVIKEVINRELARKGQVFYLHNNIDTIYGVSAKIQKMSPHVRVAVAHGRMDKDEIEDVMLSFINKEYDVLLCTTIIETGIDIPNANTIIIDQADRFGLSQLYQIKGRVGRSYTLAYAYLMYSPGKQLSEVASKRLKAIKDFAKLGSGYKIAMRDLTIRGAGDLLGPNQSGFINTVGIDLYLEILNQAIAKKRGTYIEEETTEKVNIKNVDSYIPNKFTDYDLQKLELYQKLEKISKLEDLHSLIESTCDLYGKLPKAVNLLFEKKKLELLLNEEKIDNFKQIRDVCEITISAKFSDGVDGVKLFSLVNEISRDIRLKFINKKIVIVIPTNIDWLAASIKVLRSI